MNQCHGQYALLLYELQRERGFNHERLFNVSAYEKRVEVNVPEKSMSFREHDAGLHDVTFSRARSQGSHAAEMISVHSQRGRENRGTTVEQLVSSDHHKLLCLHLTLPATLLYWGQHAKSSFSVVSVATTGWGGKTTCEQQTTAAELIFPVWNADRQPNHHLED